MFALRLCSIIVLTAGLRSLSARADDVPARSAGGQTLSVPKAHLNAGDVYYVTPGEDTQLICTSEAPLQRTLVTCNRVVGYLVVPFDLEPGQTPLVGGAFRVPVASLTTGIQAYDKLLRGKAMLNAAETPEITATITKVGAAETTPTAKGRTAYKLELGLQLSVKGKTLDLTAPAEIELIPFTWRTMNRNVGELLKLRTRFELNLADLGVEKPGREFADRVADTLNVDVFLLGNTVTPDENNDPKFKHGEYAKLLRFLTYVRDFKDAEQGYEFGRTVLREIWDSPGTLQALAQAVLSEDGLEKRDLEFALAAAQRANEITKGADGATLQSLAQICFEKGDLAAAIRHQRAAVDAGKAEQADELRENLQKYEAAAQRASSRPAGASAASPPSRALDK